MLPPELDCVKAVKVWTSAVVPDLWNISTAAEPIVISMTSIVTVVVTADAVWEFPSESMKDSTPESVYTCVPARVLDVNVPVVLPAETDVVVPTRMSVPEPLSIVQMFASPDVYDIE